MTAGPVSIGPAVQLKPGEGRADMASMAQTQDTDRWTPGDADRRVADELDRAGIRVGGGRRRTDWTLPAYAEPITEPASLREWLGLAAWSA